MMPRLLSLLRATVVLAGFAGFAEAQEPGFFSNNIVGNAPPAGFTTAPILDDTAASAANVAGVLGSAPPPPAVQVRMELQSSEALAVLANFPIKYILTEFNTLGADRRTRFVADAALSSGASAGAFVGNFNLYPNEATDPTRPPSEAAKFSGIDYNAARGQLGAQLGNQFASPALLPGSADFRDPAQANSNAPNIRSALFVLPIQRLTLAELGLRGLAAPPTDATAYAIAASPRDPAQRLMPWVQRFNNLDNPALGGGPNGTGFGQNAATPSNGQLPSRGDFQAQMLHYRLRGADDLLLVGSTTGQGNTAVVGYSDALAQADVATGWNASTLANEIIARQNYAFANLSNSIADAVDASGPVVRDTEAAGAVWSGVYDRAGSADPDGQRKLAILISNLSAVQKTIDLPDIGGFNLEHPTTTDPRPAAFVLDAGTHRLLSFTLAPGANSVTAWVLTDDTFIGLDNNRNGVGISTPFPALRLDAAADSDVCANSNGNTASAPAVTANYHWAVLGGTIQGGQGTPTITYGVGQAGTAVVALTTTFTNAQNVETVNEGAAIVRIGPPSDITVSPYVVASGGGTATGPSGPGLSYQWSISGSGLLVGSALMQSVQFRAGASGTLTLHLTVTSDTGCASTSSAQVIIDQVPVVTNDRAFATANGSVDIQVLANDSDPDAGDTLTLSIESQPRFGTVMLINNGTAIRYTPNGAVQNDSFTYRVTDSHGASAVGTVTIEDFFVATIGDFRGLATPAAGTASENARHGVVRVAVSRNGAFTGYLTLAGLRRNFSGTFDANGVAQFKPALTPAFTFVRRTGESPLVLTLRLAPGGDPDQISGSLTDQSAPFANLEIVRTLTAADPSLYTYAYVAQAAPNRGVPRAEFPQGTGYSFGSVSSRGATVVRGRLADFAPVIVLDALTKGKRLPFYMPLYGGRGSISGWVNFRNLPARSDVDAPVLDWFRPPQPAAPLYQKGWPGGISVELRGSKFQAQGATSALQDLGPVDADGNAEMTLRSGGLPDTNVYDAFNIFPSNRVTKVPPNPRRFHGLVLSSIGGFNGYFRVPGETRDYFMYGVVLQKTDFITGFFLGRTGSGFVGIEPVAQPRQSP